LFTYGVYLSLLFVQGGTDLSTQLRYPLGTNHADKIRTATGKPLTELTFDNVTSGKVSAEDLRIAPETLEKQAVIAEQAGRPQLAENFRRAAELTAVPDARILEMYNALRPGASTYEQLVAIADELEGKFSAKRNAALVRDAADVYRRRDCLAE
jgi:propanediol dehydratase small subunit